MDRGHTECLSPTERANWLNLSLLDNELSVREMEKPSCALYAGFESQIKASFQCSAHISVGVIGYVRPSKEFAHVYQTRHHSRCRP